MAVQGSTDILSCPCVDSDDFRIFGVCSLLGTFPLLMAAVYTPERGFTRTGT